MFDHILTRLINTPLAIHQDKLTVITDNVVLPLLNGSRPESLQLVNALSSNKVVNLQQDRKAGTNIALINVFGSVVSKNGAGDSGITSYSSINNNIDDLSPHCTDFIFYFSTYGGEALGLGSLANKIYSLRDKGITTYAFTDDKCCSAGMRLFNACEYRYVTPDAFIGSIGTVMSLIDTTKKDQKDGVTYEILRSGEFKALGNPHEQITDTLREKSLLTLNELNGQFFKGMVEHNASLSIDLLANLKGDTFFGNSPLAKEFITGTLTNLDDLYNIILSSQTTLTQVKGNIMSNEVTLTQEDVNKAVMAEQTRCLDILNAAETFKIPTSSAIKHIKLNMSKEQTLMMYEELGEIRTSLDLEQPTSSTARLPKTQPNELNAESFSEALSKHTFNSVTLR